MTSNVMCQDQNGQSRTRRGARAYVLPGVVTRSLITECAGFDRPTNAFQPRPAPARGLPPKALAGRVTAPCRRLHTLVRRLPHIAGNPVPGARLKARDDRSLEHHCSGNTQRVHHKIQHVERRSEQRYAEVLQ